MSWWRNERMTSSISATAPMRRWVRQWLIRLLWEWCVSRSVFTLSSMFYNVQCYGLLWESKSSIISPASLCESSSSLEMDQTRFTNSSQLTGRTLWLLGANPHLTHTAQQVPRSSLQSVLVVGLTLFRLCINITVLYLPNSIHISTRGCCKRELVNSEP